MKSKAYMAGYEALSGAPNPYHPESKQARQFEQGRQDKRQDLDACSSQGMPVRLFNETIRDIEREEGLR